MTNALNELLEKYKTKDKDIAFRRAAHQGKLVDIKALYEAGVQLNGQSSNSKTALHQAVIHDAHEVVAYLQQQGAGANIPDNNEHTAFWYLPKKYIELLAASKEEQTIREQQTPQHGNPANAFSLHQSPPASNADIPN